VDLVLGNSVVCFVINYGWTSPAGIVGAIVVKFLDMTSKLLFLLGYLYGRRDTKYYHT